jgi:hypothetical protein
MPEKPESPPPLQVVMLATATLALTGSVMAAAGAGVNWAESRTYTLQADQLDDGHRKPVALRDEVVTDYSPAKVPELIVRLNQDAADARERAHGFGKFALGLGVLTVATSWYSFPLARRWLED